MAEHNGGNRGNYGGGRGDRGSFRANNNSGGDPRGFRSRDNRGGSSRGEDKPFGDRPRREGDGERRNFGDRDRKPYGERSGYGDRDRKPFGDRDRKPFGDRPRREGEGERRNFGDRDRKPFGDRDRKPFGDRDRKPFGDRPRREGDGERRNFGDRDRKPFGDRPRREGDGERRSFGDRDRKAYGERSGYGDRDRKPYGDRDRKPFGDRPRREGEGERRSFGERPERGPRKFDGPRSEGRGFGGPRAERPNRVPNASDLRSSNRPDRERSPEIDDDVTGQELDRVTKHQIKTLEGTNGDWVSKHLVMAGRLIDIDPELSFQHALAASRRGGRLSAVREAVGLTAYAAGHYGEALREFRTYRRISGSNVHLPLMADCERGLGRPDRALDVVRSPEAQDLDAPGKVELAIVASGARTDLGQLDAAVAELEIPQLDMNRAFTYSPRLFRAYADALAAVGRTEEAAKWQRQAVVAENALGVGDFEDPEIIDLGEDEEEERKPRYRKFEENAEASEERGEDAASHGESAIDSETDESDDVELDDAESDYFESDDAESDEDSAEDEDDEEQDGETKND